MNYEKVFNDFCAIIDKHKDQLYLLQFYPELLNEVKKTLDIDKEFYSYNFSTIRFVIPKKSLPSHSIPKNLGDVEIILSIKDEIVIKRSAYNLVEDPLLKLKKFNIVLRSNDFHTSSWHLDRHIQEEDEGSPNCIHPIYHLTFGGYHMEGFQNEGDEFGMALIVRAPRIMHPPMELLLGIDFIFNHFIPKDELDLLNDPSYISIIMQLKKYFWMPYSLAMAKNFCETIDIDNKRFDFDNKFVTSVLSC